MQQRLLLVVTKGVACAVVATVLTGQLACPPPSATCQSDSDCASGQVCFSGVCRNACNGNADCAGDESCINGVCQPGNAMRDAATGDGATDDRAPADRGALDRAATDRGPGDSGPSERIDAAAPRDSAGSRDGTASDQTGVEHGDGPVAGEGVVGADSALPRDAAPANDAAGAHDSAPPSDAAIAQDSALPTDAALRDVETCPVERCTDGYCRVVGECCEPVDCGGPGWSCDTYHQCLCDDGTGLGISCHNTMHCSAGDLSCTCYPGGDCCSAIDDCGGDHCIGHMCEPT